MKYPNENQIIRVKFKQEYSGIEVIGLVMSVQPSRIVLTDACYADTRKEIGYLPINVEVIESFEVCK